MYNMAFKMRDIAAEAKFIAGLELEGVHVRMSGGWWLCYGLSESNRRYIEKHSTQFRAL